LSVRNYRVSIREVLGGKMMSAIFTRACTLLIATALTAAPAGAVEVKKGGYVSFDPPGSVFTWPLRINDHGAIVGYWFDGNFYHGFLRAPNGATTTFDPPNSENTTPLGINDNGIVVGTYQTSLGNNSVAHGFIRDAKGNITTYDAPGSGGYTSIWGINKAGTITGYYSDNSGRNHGFVQDAKGNFTSFDPPNSLDTTPAAINDDGTITGEYIFSAIITCGNAEFGGFVRAPDGTIATFVVQNGGIGTAINAKNVVAGGSVDENCVVNGLVRAANGTLTVFNPPGFSGPTYSQGINDKGTIVGWYFDQHDNDFGFQRTKKGVFTLIEPENAVTSEANAINAKGQITGIYADSSHLLHGFLYTP
jgi:uncharacterized membrane protein